MLGKLFCHLIILSRNVTILGISLQYLLEVTPPVQPRQHRDSQGEQVEEEEVVDPVADPDSGDEGRHGGDKVQSGVLLLGLAAHCPTLLQSGEQGHDLGAGRAELLLLLPSPAVGLEDL